MQWWRVPADGVRRPIAIRAAAPDCAQDGYGGVVRMDGGAVTFKGGTISNAKAVRARPWCPHVPRRHVLHGTHRMLRAGCALWHADRWRARRGARMPRCVLCVGLFVCCTLWSVYSRFFVLGASTHTPITGTQPLRRCALHVPSMRVACCISAIDAPDACCISAIDTPVACCTGDGQPPRSAPPCGAWHSGLHVRCSIGQRAGVAVAERRRDPLGAQRYGGVLSMTSGTALFDAVAISDTAAEVCAGRGGNACRADAHRGEGGGGGPADGVRGRLQ